MYDKNKPLLAAERVRLARWVNKVEEAADLLLDLLRTPPTPLPRTPVIDPALVDLLAAFTLSQDDQSAEDYPMVRFLSLGNGHQVTNKRNAMACFVKLFDAKQIDRNTVEFGKWGICHFASYTHPRGAMISTPNKDDHEYGRGDWHHKERIIMFRDVGDGRCIVYLTKIEPLFEKRTIGQHGVTWEDVRQTAEYIKVIASADALKAAQS